MTAPLLALESSTATGSVAVGDGAGLRAEMVLNVVGAHSSALLPAVDAVVRAAGLTPAELGGIVVGSGPGSFTGLRIAAATAKGLVHGLGIPLFAYSSLLAAATAGWASGGPVCALFDARKRDVFAGCWSFASGGGAPGEESAGQEAQDPATGLEKSGNAAADERHPLHPIRTLLEPAALSIGELIERFRHGPAPLFVGDGAVIHGEELRRELGARVMPPGLGVPRASALLWLAGVAPALGSIPEPAAWEPEYVREPGAVRIAAARAESAAAQGGTS